MHNKQYLALCLVVLISCQAFALPQPTSEIARKFAEKPNTLKKVASSSLDDIEDLSSNSIQVNKGRQIQVKIISTIFCFYFFVCDAFFISFYFVCKKILAREQKLLLT